MAEREYKILVANSRAGIYLLETDGWTVLENTIKQFRSLDTDDDLTLGSIGRVAVRSAGFVALAWK